ncbi:MAG: nicotinate-nucleotide adenylyltransferase [candidate division KSB1 bacterium]|nr:nicotinate-nucleotide adenylyltransferase [candidate division KSB1 bacterium]
MRVGIFGGTFDPIHNGHLAIAQTAINELPLDKVLFIPAAIPPHKMHQEISAPDIRLKLVQLAIADNPQFEFSTIELDREGPSYMVDTVRQLKAEHPDWELFLIIGADNLLGFREWHQPKEILQRCKLAVYPRYEADVQQVPESLLKHSVIFKAPRMEISSSYIRRLVFEGKSIRYLVPDTIDAYIRQEGLYGRHLRAENGEVETGHTAH